MSSSLSIYLVSNKPFRKPIGQLNEVLYHHCCSKPVKRKKGKTPSGASGKKKQPEAQLTRFEAPLLTPEDFPTDEKEALNDYGFEVERLKLEEKKRGFGFRSGRRRGGGGGGGGPRR